MHVDTHTHTRYNIYMHACEHFVCIHSIINTFIQSKISYDKHVLKKCVYLYIQYTDS